jgi:hypothetical protein
VFVQRKLAVGIDVIADDFTVLKCGTTPGEFSSVPVLVKRELRMVFDTADTTWLLFVSEPMEFVCSNVKANYTAPHLEPGIPCIRLYVYSSYCID